MNADPLPLPPARVTPDLGRAFGGIWRLALRRYLAPGHWLLLAAALALLVLLATAIIHRAANDVTEARNYFKWVVEFYLTFLLPIFAFIMAGGTLRDELKPESVDYVFTRPVPRRAYIVGRFLSHLACAQLDGLLAFAALLGVGIYRHVPGLFEPVALLLFAQVLAITVASAFGFLFGLLSSRYVVIGLFYGFIVEIGAGQIPTQLNRLSMIHQIRAMFPSFELPPGAELPPPASPLGVAAVTLGLSLVLLAATAVLFRYRELAGAQGKGEG